MQPVDHMCFLGQWSPNILAPGNGFVEDNFSTDGGGGVGDVSGGNASDGSGSNASNGEQWGAADEASVAGTPLTSCCAAQFLTGSGLVLVHGPGNGDPCSAPYSKHEEFLNSR